MPLWPRMEGNCCWQPSPHPTCFCQEPPTVTPEPSLLRHKALSPLLSLSLCQMQWWQLTPVSSKPLLFSLKWPLFPSTGNCMKRGEETALPDGRISTSEHIRNAGHRKSPTDNCWCSLLLPKTANGTSLVAWWLRTRLPMQGHGSVPAPGRFHVLRGSWAHVPQLLKPQRPRACALQLEKPLRGEACTAQEWPPAAATRGSPHTAREGDPAQPETDNSLTQRNLTNRATVDPN